MSELEGMQVIKIYSTVIFYKVTKMIRTNIILLLLLNILGCASMQRVEPFFRVRSPSSIGHVNPLQFEKSTEKPAIKHEPEKVTVRFEGVKVREAMRTLTDITNKPIACDSSIENELIYGTFIEQPLSQVLEIIARRCKVSVADISNVYYLGEYKEGDRVTAVIRIPPVSRDELKEALSAFSTEHGKCTIIGSFVWISDTLENIRKIVTDLEDIRTRSERSYLAEVYFIRVNEDDFLQLTADLRFNSVDIFSSAFNVEQLFSMFVSADAKLGSVLIDTRPVLLLSEGRKALFEVGNEVVRERKAVSDNGVIQTTGYDKFTDGIILSLNLSRVSDERYSVDMDLEVSAFDKTDKTSPVPTKSHSVLKSPGLLIRDGGVVYAGSLKRKDASKIFGLFSIDTARMSDMLTIWLRIREIK
jgi:type II secretory pathway component GspD/PulD (secretin)